MDKAKYRRLRQIILDSTTIHDDGISFDTDIALKKGYFQDEIAIADELLTNCSFFTADFLDKIRYLRCDSEYKPRIYFVEFAKIIFILDKDLQKCRHIFEEELEKQVLFKQYTGICENYLQSRLVGESHDSKSKIAGRFGGFFGL